MEQVELYDHRLSMYNHITTIQSLVLRNPTCYVPRSSTATVLSFNVSGVLDNVPGVVDSCYFVTLLYLLPNFLTTDRSCAIETWHDANALCSL